MSRASDMSVLGLFSIDRGMLLVIIGETLTYLIILIEFKNEDDSDISCNITGENLGNAGTGTTYASLY